MIVINKRTSAAVSILVRLYAAAALKLSTKQKIHTTQLLSRDNQELSSSHWGNQTKPLRVMEN